MKERFFEELARGLRRRGISPSLARRLVMELSDHVDDAAEELQAQGLSAGEACRQAIENFGPPEEFARMLASEYQRRSFAGRHPLLSFGLGPVVAVALLLLSPIWLGSLLGMDAQTTPVPFTDIPIYQAYAVTAKTLNMVTPFIAGILFAAICMRSRLRTAWAVLSCVILSLIGLALTVTLAFDPSPDKLHSSSYTLGLALSPHVPALNLIAALLPLLVIATYVIHRNFIEK